MAPARRSSSAGSGEVCLGQISGVFGTRGELRLFLFNREPGFLLGQPRPVTLVSPEGERRPARLGTRAGTAGRVIGRIEGVSDREAARALMGWDIVVSTAALPRTEPGEYYHHQLLGLRVEGTDGVPLGTLAEIHSGEVDIWVVRGLGDERYVPALKDTVREVDLEGGRVVIDVG